MQTSSHSGFITGGHTLSRHYPRSGAACCSPLELSRRKPESFEKFETIRQAVLLRAHLGSDAGRHSASQSFALEAGERGIKRRDNKRGNNGPHPTAPTGLGSGRRTPAGLRQVKH